MKNINLLVAIIAIFNTSIASAVSLGLVRDGQHLNINPEQVTRVKVEAIDFNDPQYQSLNEAIAKVESTIEGWTLEESLKGKMQKGLLPSRIRQYFVIPHLSEDESNQIKRAYRQAMLPEEINDQIVIFAVTNRNTNETYILPDFFKIQDKNSAAAIIFHEMLWAMPTPMDYQLVMKSEHVFEQYLEKNIDDFDVNLYRTLAKVFNIDMIPVNAAAYYDIKYQRVGQLAKENCEVLPLDLYGPQFTKGAILDHMISKTFEFPESHFWNELLNLQDKWILDDKLWQYASSSYGYFDLDGSLKKNTINICGMSSYEAFFQRLEDHVTIWSKGFWVDTNAIFAIKR